MWWQKIFNRNLKNKTNFLFQRQKTILSGASVIAFMVILSSILGLVRKRLYAGTLAAGEDYDTLVAAFKIPDFIFQLLVAGSLNSAFIPLFSRYIVDDRGKRAWEFASAILNITLIFFVSLGLIGLIFAPQLAVLIAPGFSSEQHIQLARLMRIIMFSPLFLGLSSFMGGIVQSFRRFLVPFFSPVVYNLGAILGIIFLYPPLGIDGMAWGVLLGSVLHLLVVLPLLKHLGFRYRFRFLGGKDFWRQISRLAFPRTIWTIFIQFREMLIVFLLSSLPSGSLSVLDYAQAIIRLPVNAFGSSVAQACLPSLSELVAEKKDEEFRLLFLDSLLQIFYIILPLSVVFIVLKIPLVRLVFGTGNFDWWETVYTAWVVAFLGLSLFAQAGKELLVRAFYAHQETVTPVVIGVIVSVITLGMIWVLPTFWGVRGVALSLSLGYILEFLVLFFVLMRKLKYCWGDVILPTGKIIFASLVLGLALWFPVQMLDQVFIDTSRVVNLVVLLWVVLTFGGSVYFLLTWFLGCKQIRMFLKILLQLKTWGDFLHQSEMVAESAALGGREESEELS